MKPSVRVLCWATAPLVLSQLAACVSYPPYQPGYRYPPRYAYQRQPTAITYVDAPVVKVTPVYRDVQVAEPRKECAQVPVDNQANKVAGTLLGAALGGLVGNQFGKGSGNAAMTAAGAVAGAAAGQSIASQGDGQTVTRCQTVNDYVLQRQPDGYDVTYRLNGQTYHTHTAYDPGSTIRVRVAVTPDS